VVRGGRVTSTRHLFPRVLLWLWCVWCRCRRAAPRCPSAAGPWSVPRARLSRCIAGRGRKTGAAARGGAGGPRWSRGDSNPGPPPCKGGALPAKLRPPVRGDRERSPADGSLVLPSPVARRPSTRPVGAPGLEPGTSALSGPRSDRLSYAPRRPPPSVARHSVRRGRPSPPRGGRGSEAEDGARTQCRGESFVPRGAAASLPAARPVVTRPPPPDGAPADPSTPTRKRGEGSGARCPSRRLRRPGA
jgi:hypothetical protein